MAWGLNRISNRELLEWMAYERVEPFGPWRDDFRAAITPTLVANIFRKKDQKAHQIEDFMLKSLVKPPEAEVTPQQRQQHIKSMVEMWNAALGGLDLREKQNGTE